MTPITCGLLFYLLVRFPTVVFFHFAAWKKVFEFVKVDLKKKKICDFF